MELSIDFITLESLRKASNEERINMIIERIKDKKIIVLNARFNPEDEALLIEKTMEQVNKKFPGIEICSLSNEELVKNPGLLTRIRNHLIKLLTGGKSGITVIGPARIVKEIKREPDRIRLLTK